MPSAVASQRQILRTPDPPPLAIETDHLTREFDNARAVDRLSLRIPAGTVFGFLGHNGAGKTTTIRLLLGLLEPTSGSARVLGYDTRTAADRIRQRTGALLEHAGLYERLSAEQNLEFYARIWQLPSAARQERIRELLSELALWDRRREPVGRWSRGMKQKLAVARALLHRPTLLFLDEPTAGLDPVAAASLRDDLAGLARREGTTIFVTTHNLVEAEHLCDQVGVIRRGELVAVGRPDELRAHSREDRIEIVARGVSESMLEQLRALPGIVSVSQDGEHIVVHMSAPASAAPVVKLLVREGAAVEEVHRGSRSLEDAVLSLMGEGA